MPGQVVRKEEPAAPEADYAITAVDCDALGKQYGEVARADQMLGVSPKLNEKQRAAAAASVDKVVSKLEDAWIESCRNNLVGKMGDRKSFQCAMATKTVKAFDVCLNGEQGTPQNKDAGKPKGAAKKK